MRKIMNKLLALCMYGIVLCSTSIHAASDFTFWTDPKARSIAQEVVEELRHIPLLDGQSIFGDHIEGVYYSIDNLDNDWRKSSHQETKFRDLFNNPIKSKGWFSNTYYTPEEILTLYRALAERSCRLNPSTLGLFSSILECGRAFETPIPGLTKQPERAALFNKLYELRLKKGPEAKAELIAIGKELEAKAAARSAAVTDLTAESVPAPTNSNLRHRRPSPAGSADDDAYAEDSDHSDESTALLGPKND